MKTRVLVADDHAAIRQMLGGLLAREGSYEMVAEARTGFEALKLCRKMKPQLVVLDLMLPEMNGVEVIRTLRSEQRETRVLVFSGTQNRELIAAALQARPHGFVHKGDPLETFREALKAVMNGCLYFTPFATNLLDDTRGGNSGWDALTHRERAVLQMVAEGMSNKEMAARLGIAAKTVEHHRAALMVKLDLHDVARLTRYAVRMGVVPG